MIALRLSGRLSHTLTETIEIGRAHSTCLISQSLAREVGRRIDDLVRRTRAAGAVGKRLASIGAFLLLSEADLAPTPHGGHGGASVPVPGGGAGMGGEPPAGWVGASRHVFGSNQAWIFIGAAASRPLRARFGKYCYPSCYPPRFCGSLSLAN